MRLTDFLDLLGVLCLSLLAFVIWAPAALGVIGVSALLASYGMTRAPRSGGGK